MISFYSHVSYWCITGSTANNLPPGIITKSVEFVEVIMVTIVRFTVSSEVYDIVTYTSRSIVPHSSRWTTFTGFKLPLECR